MRFAGMCAWVVFVLLALGGCGVFGGSVDSSLDTGLNLGGNNGNNNGGGNQNDNAFEVNASGGTTPTYTWEGGGAHSISVVRTSAPTTVVWAAAFVGTTDGIDSGVVHAVVPAGAVEAIRTEPVLTAGVEYRVSVARQANGGEAGWIEFTP